MRIGLVVDSACDLPVEFYRENKLVILPITVRLGDQELIDRRHPEETADFYRNHLDQASQGETEAFSVEQIKRLFLDRLVLDYDFVFSLILASSRSPMFDNATQASLSILSDYKPIRAAAGLQGPFSLRVVDTQTLFAGQGVLAAEVVRLIKEGTQPNRIRERLDALIPQTYGYMLPRSLGHLRSRAAKKGDKSVGWVKYAVASALDIKPLIRGFRNETGPVANLKHFDDGAARCFKFIRARIAEGLLTPIVCVSYAGDLAELAHLPGYRETVEFANQSGVQLLSSVMSTTGAVNVGEGALAFAFCSPPHDFS